MGICILTNNGHIPDLTSERLKLRQIALTDNIEIFALRSNPDVNQYLDRKACQSPEEAHSFIESIVEKIKRNKAFYWAITAYGNDNLIGTICLFNFSTDGLSAEIGYELIPAFHGKGIMYEAVSWVIKFGFEKLHLETIEAYTHFENLHSIKLLKKLNFEISINRETITNDKFMVFSLSSKPMRDK